MTDKTMAAIEAFIKKWAPAGKVPEFTKDVGELFRTAVKECTDHVIGRKTA